MSDQQRGEQIQKLSLAAAMAQSYARDQDGFPELVASLLEASLPQQTIVERKPTRLFSQEKRVVKVMVTVNDERYEMLSPKAGYPPTAQIVKIVRGITLKTEAVGIDQWLNRLAVAVEHHARGSEVAADAISEFLRSFGL